MWQLIHVIAICAYKNEVVGIFLPKCMSLYSIYKLTENPTQTKIDVIVFT